MEADPKIMLQYASKYAGSSNGWKKWIGMNETFEKLGVEARRAAEEQAFTEWVNAGGEERIARYGKALENINAAVEGRKNDNILMTYINESVGRIELVSASGQRQEDYGCPCGRGSCSKGGAAGNSKPPSGIILRGLFDAY